MATVTEAITWIPLARARREAAIGRSALADLIDSGRLSVRNIPGSRPRVRLDELEAIIEASTRRATSGGASC